MNTTPDPYSHFTADAPFSESVFGSAPPTRVFRSPLAAAAARLFPPAPPPAPSPPAPHSSILDDHAAFVAGCWDNVKAARTALSAALRENDSEAAETASVAYQKAGKAFMDAQMAQEAARRGGGGSGQ